MSDQPAQPSAFGLQGDEYWTAPWKNLDDIAWKRVGESKAGILIDMPPTFVVKSKDKLPLLVFRTASAKEFSQTSFWETAVIAGVELETGIVQCVRPADGRDRPPQKPEASGDEESFGGREYNVDALFSGAVPDRPTTRLITLIIRDVVSNRVRTRVVVVPVSTPDPNAAKALAEARALVPAGDVKPAEGTPGVLYADVPGAPPLPEKEGLALAAERVVVLKKDAVALVRGSFRLPVLPQDLPAADKPPSGLDKKKERTAPCTAIARIGIVAIGADDNFPRVYGMGVPSFAPVAGTKERPIATGTFQFDLLRDPKIALTPQTYFIYAFSFEQMTGPAVVGLVTEDKLPKKP